MQKLGNFLLVGLCSLCLVQAQGQTIQFEKYTLPNGLKIILHEDHSAPVVAVTALYHVGSKNEDTARTGFAHFFEHLLFEGTDNIKRGEFEKYRVMRIAAGAHDGQFKTPELTRDTSFQGNFSIEEEIGLE